MTSPHARTSPPRVLPSAGIGNLVDLARESVSRFADRPLFGEREGGTWQWLSYRDWNARVDRLRAALAELGVRPADRVAIVSRNSAAWAVAAYASYGLGAEFVPMYESQRAEDWEFILRDCGATVVFARTLELATTLAAMQPGLPQLRHIITLEGGHDDPRSLSALIRPDRTPVPPLHPAPDDVAGLVYTSGTTGLPKGVMLTHRNLTTNAVSTITEFPIGPDDRTVSFLPWAHVFGQLVELHLLIAVGASTAFNTSTDKLLDDLRSVQPTILVAVPRIFNRLHANVRGELEHRPRLLRNVFHRGIEASIHHHRGESLGPGDRVAYWASGLLFAAVKRKLGGRLRYAISGSATLSREVAEFINALGIEVYEGYGLTESSPVITFNRPGQRKFGSVGLPLANVTVSIDETLGDTKGEGEIIVHGPNVMKGYHARPDENARVFTADGGLRTGDLGRIDKDGFLYITGRIKEQYKLENGKYVMPTPLEERLALSPFIRNVMLHGAAKPYNVALVVVDPERIRAWAQDQGYQLAPDLGSDERVRDLIQAELDHEAKDFRTYERPLACLVTEQQLTVENGLLTPTLKLKRRAVLARFGAALDSLYERRQPQPPVPRPEPAPQPPSAAR